MECDVAATRPPALCTVSKNCCPRRSRCRRPYGRTAAAVCPRRSATHPAASPSACCSPRARRCPARSKSRSLLPGSTTRPAIELSIPKLRRMSSCWRTLCTSTLDSATQATLVEPFVAAVPAAHGDQRVRFAIRIAARRGRRSACRGSRRTCRSGRPGRRRNCA